MLHIPEAIAAVHPHVYLQSGALVLSRALSLSFSQQPAQQASTPVQQWQQFTLVRMMVVVVVLLALVAPPADSERCHSAAADGRWHRSLGKPKHQVFTYKDPPQPA